MHVFPALTAERVSPSLSRHICPACPSRLQRMSYACFLKRKLPTMNQMCQMFSCSLSTREHIATKEGRPSLLLLWWKSLPSDANIFEARNHCKHHTWSAVEVAEHFGAGHRDSLSNVCRAPACDIVPDTTAAWKEKQRIRWKSWAMRTQCLEGDRRMSDHLNAPQEGNCSSHSCQSIFQWDTHRALLR